MRLYNADGSYTDYKHEDDRLVASTVFDATPTMEHAANLRSAGAIGTKNMRHVASVDERVIHHLLKEAGIRWDDTRARKDFLKKKLMDGTLSKFRVWEGTF